MKTCRHALVAPLLAAALACGGEDSGAVPDAGAEDIDSGSGADAATGPLTLASGLALPCCLAIDGSTLFLISQGGLAGGGSLASISTSGGTPTPLVENLEYPVHLAVDSTDVYWVDASDYTVLTVARAGGAPTTLANDQEPWAVAIDGDNIYWSNVDSVMMAPKAAGAPAPLASGLGYVLNIAVDSTHLYFAEEGDNDASNGAIMRVPIAGGSVETIASGQAAPQELAVDDDSVYWHNRDDGTVMKVAKTGGSPVTLASDQISPAGIWVDGDTLYWTTAGDFMAANGTVMKVPTAGGNPTTIASGQDLPWGLVTDATHVYWVNSGTTPATPSGALMSAPK